MLVSVHKNHNKWSNVTAVQHFCNGYDHANHVLLRSFRGSKYLLKI